MSKGTLPKRLDAEQAGLGGARYTDRERVDLAHNHEHKQFQKALVEQMLFQKPFFQKAGYSGSWYISNPSEISWHPGADIFSVDFNDYQHYGILERVDYFAIPGSRGGLTFQVNPTHFMMTLLNDCVHDERDAK